MIRWRFILTRLLIVVAIVMLLRWGLSPVAQYATVQLLESVVGAKAEIGETHVGYFPPRVIYKDFRVADPRHDKEYSEAFRADNIELTIDGDAILHRRFVIRDARIDGMRIGQSRDSSGHLPSDESPAEIAPEGPSVAERLFGSISKSAEEQADALLEQMETKRVSMEIRQSWEKEYRQLAQRARDLESQVRQLRDRARGISNPLRDWPEMEKTLAEANAVRNELLSVRQKIDSLPNQAQQDFERLEKAKDHDVAMVQDIIPVDLSQGGDVAIDLLAASVRQQIAQFRGYLDTGRTIADYTVVAPKSERFRGEDFDLEGDARRPSVLVRQCEVGGLLRANGKIYSLTGMLENLTNTPQILENPTRARLRLEGPEVIRLEYVRDERGGRDSDLLTLHFPEMKAAPVRLGDAKSFGVAVNGGQREIWIQVRNENDQLQGRLVSKQSDAQLDLVCDDKLQKLAAMQSLRSSLSGVDRIEVDAHFEGEWDDLNIRLSTNLSRIFKQATEDAVASQVEATRTELTAKVQTAHEEQTQNLRIWLAEQQREALSVLASADQSIEEMRQKVLGQVGNAESYLGKLRLGIPNMR